MSEIRDVPPRAPEGTPDQQAEAIRQIARAAYPVVEVRDAAIAHLPVNERPVLFYKIETAVFEAWWKLPAVKAAVEGE